MSKPVWPIVTNGCNVVLQGVTFLCKFDFLIMEKLFWQVVVANINATRKKLGAM